MKTKFNEKEYTTIKEFDKEKLYKDGNRIYRVKEVQESYLILSIVSDSYDNGFTRKVSKKVLLTKFKEV